MFIKLIFNFLIFFYSLENLSLRMIFNYKVIILRVKKMTKTIFYALIVSM